MKAKLLALALGWKEEQIKPCTHEGAVIITREDGVKCDFSVKCKEHFWKIAEAFDCFPFRRWDGKWCVQEGWRIWYGSSPEEAVYNYVTSMGR